MKRSIEMEMEIERERERIRDRVKMDILSERKSDAKELKPGV